MRAKPHFRKKYGVWSCVLTWHDDYAVVQHAMGFGYTWPDAWLDYLRTRAMRTQS